MTTEAVTEMRTELAKLVAEGRNRDQIVAYYTAKYGSSEPLASPPDRGFNRLAWLVPYGLGASGLVLIGLVAVRWSRRPANPEAPSAETETLPANSALEAKLDDELSNLD